MALALVAWFAVGSEERTETNLHMALELVNIPKNLMVTNDIPTQIEVRLQGPRSVIRELTTERLQKRLDLSGVKPGSQVFPLSLNSLDFPRGVTLTRIRPNAIPVVLDQALTRSLEVKPVIKGEPASGFELEEISLSPTEVKVRGPKNELSQLKNLNTIPIDIANLRASGKREVELDFQNLPLTYIDNKPLFAQINIRPKQDIKVISEVEVIPSWASGPVRIYPARVVVTVGGPAPQLQELQAEDVNALVYLKNLKPGSHKLRVNVELPEGLDLIRIKPETVRVRLWKPRPSN